VEKQISRKHEMIGVKAVNPIGLQKAIDCPEASLMICLVGGDDWPLRTTFLVDQLPISDDD